MSGKWSARGAEMAAVFMIGDGLLGLLQPRRHVGLWAHDALGAEAVVRPFDGRPRARQVYGLIQIGAGLALAARQRSARAQVSE